MSKKGKALPRSCIRDVMRGRGPMRAGAVCDLLGATTREERLHICHSLGSMVREGVMTKAGSGMSIEYTLVRDPVERLNLPKAELVRRRQERERKRYARKHKESGGMTRAEYNVKRAAERAERLAQREKDRAAAREAKRAAAMAALEARSAKPKTAPTPRASFPKPTTDYAKQGRLMTRQTIARVFAKPEPVEVAAETVEQWMARTGKQPEVLPPGAVSNPLRVVGVDL